MKIRYRVALITTIGVLVAGGLLLVVNAWTFEYATYRDPSALTKTFVKKLHVSRATVVDYLRAHPDAVFRNIPGTDGSAANPVTRAFREAQRTIQADAVARSRRWTAVAIGVVAVLAGIIGLFATRRLLRPIRRISESAKHASADDLSARVALEGPADELKDLSDTFDAMLDRLDHSFAAQRRFSAQVSHELRTSLAVIRSEADNILAGDDTAAAAQNIRDATERARTIIDSLLALGRADGKPFESTPIRADLVVGDALGELAESTRWDHVRLDADLHEAWISGDRALIDCAFRNLAENALRHAGREGRVHVHVGTEGAAEELAVIDVANSMAAGPVDDRTGHGIGLTVVEAVARAHDGHSELDVSPTEARARLVVPALRSTPPSADGTPLAATTPR